MSTPIQGKAISLFGKPLTPVPPNPVANDGIKFNFTTLQWELAPFGGAGEANTSSNVGTGAVLALPKVGVDLPFKSLSGNPEIVLTPTATEILFAIGAIAQSKITGLVADLLTKIETSSNVGAGAGLALAKVGVDLPFKSFIALAPLLLTVNPTDITISITQVPSLLLHNMNTDSQAAPGTRFSAFSGSDASSSFESNAENTFPAAIKTKNMTIRLSAMSDTDSIVTVRKNGANGNQTITIPANTTGTFRDVTNTDNYGLADIGNYQMIINGVGTAVLDSMALEVVSQ